MSGGQSVLSSRHNQEGQSQADQGALYRAAWLFATLVVSIGVTWLHMSVTFPWKLATFSKLIHFEAAEPFQHRILLPAIVAGAQQVLPLGEALLFGVLEVIGWLALIAVAYRGLTVFAIGRREFTRRLLAFSVVIPMGLHLILPDFNLFLADAAEPGLLQADAFDPRPLFYYVYDLPAAAFTLAMAVVLARQARLAHGRSFALYLGLFALATVNRETTVFMLPFFALLFWPVLTFRRWCVLLALQVGIYVAIQLPLNWLFSDNLNPSARLAGTQYEFHLLHNLLLLANPVYLLAFSARFAAGLYLPILVWWRYLDWRIAAALIGFGLPLFAFAMLAGRAQEHRVFIELIPLIWLGGLQVMATRSAARQASPPPGLSTSSPAASA